MIEDETFYNEGWDAYIACEMLEDNPYDEGTYAYNQWEMGWTACEDEYDLHIITI